MKTLLGFLRANDGATAVEYGLLAAILGGVLIATLGGLGDNLEGVLNTISNAISPP